MFSVHVVWPAWYNYNWVLNYLLRRNSKRVLLIIETIVDGFYFRRNIRFRFRPIHSGQ